MNVKQSGLNIRVEWCSLGGRASAPVAHRTVLAWGEGQAGKKKPVGVWPSNLFAFPPRGQYAPDTVAHSSQAVSLLICWCYLKPKKPSKPRKPNKPSKGLEAGSYIACCYALYMDLTLHNMSQLLLQVHVIEVRGSVHAEALSTQGGGVRKTPSCQCTLQSWQFRLTSLI